MPLKFQYFLIVQIQTMSEAPHTCSRQVIELTKSEVFPCVKYLFSSHHLKRYVSSSSDFNDRFMSENFPIWILLVL